LDAASAKGRRRICVCRPAKFAARAAFFAASGNFFPVKISYPHNSAGAVSAV
jgi:hypothetical protein